MPVIPKKKKFREEEVGLSEKRRIKRLIYLTKNIPRCVKCPRLRINGMAIPFWSRKSRYLALAEAPGEEEVEKGKETPLVGPAGYKWQLEIERLGLKREDFVLINSVQCRPVVNGRNGKPTFEEMANCCFWVKKYIEAAEPEKILVMGNHAVWSLLGGKGTSLGGITKISGKFIGIHRGIPVYACIHPASLLYSNDNLSLFRKSLKKFKEA